MNINDLVPDREICQEAKEKGMVIESSFYWTELNGEWFIIDVLDGYSIPKGDEDRFISAPLTDEILQKLPETINRYDRLFCLRITKTAGNYFAWYEEFETDDGIDYSLYFEDKKLSNALLLLYIKLVDEGILKI